MPREVRDEEGTSWSCVQAYAGLSEGPDKDDAARVEGSPDLLHVVCTPSGGAQSVRLQLPDNWEELPDEALVRAITAARK